MDKNISSLLQEIKMHTGWSEPHIAAELGISQPTVNRILNGQNDCQGSTWRAIDALYKRIVKSTFPIRGHPIDGATVRETIGKTRRIGDYEDRTK